MKFTQSWLAAHLASDAGSGEIAATLSRIGLETESVVSTGAQLAGFLVARVVAAERHPAADKLQVLTVDAGPGAGALQVVCGAANARAGLVGVFAPPGTYVPGADFTIARAKIRGVESFGMMCSAAELKLAGGHDGIIELPADAPAGAPYASYAGLDDTVIEIAVTPNRPDCLGVRGIARDLAAAGLGALRPPAPGFSGGGGAAWPVRIERPEDGLPVCHAFATRTLSGLSNGTSPAWLATRLAAIGAKPISAIVDATNYVMFDRCRPLHAYDAAKLSGELVVRNARAGEVLDALDGRRYALAPGMCVIADDDGVVGLAGIIGGARAAVTPETDAIVLEGAYFDAHAIARTGRALGLNSDARFRFERGIDPASGSEGVNLCTALILAECGGTASRLGETIAVAEGDPPNAISFDPALVERLTGLILPRSESVAILRALGFEVGGKAPEQQVRVPSWRPDVHGAADLVEEIVRIHGIDAVPATPLPQTAGVPRPLLTPLQARTGRAKRTLAARGLVEAVTYSFIERRIAEAFATAPVPQLANPLSAELGAMRPSLLPGLLAAAAANARRGARAIALFEVGQVFAGTAPGDQKIAATTLRMGAPARDWRGRAPAPDMLAAKADALALLHALGIDAGRALLSREAPAWYHPGRSGAWTLGRTRLAVFGELHPAVLALLDCDGPAVACELVLDDLPRARARTQRPPLVLPDLMPLTRDFAFVVAADTPAGEVLRAARGVDEPLIAGIALFDVFEGAALGPERKSLGIEVTLQPHGASLTEAEIDAVTGRLVARVAKATGATVRV